MTTSPPAYSFVHLRGPDSAGHSYGWDPTPGSTYSNSVREIDDLLGRIFAVVQGSAMLNGTTTILLTTDHGGSGTHHGEADVAVHYTVPLYAWGAAVAAGADLYELNAGVRPNPASSRPDYGASVQPVRNGDVANAALGLLGLPVVAGSHINVTAPLRLE